VFSTLYSYSFAQNSDWTREYPGQEEILAYLVRVAQEYNLYQHVRFNTTVEEASWDDELLKWRTRVTTAKGSKDAEFNPEYEIKSDFLVSAVGQLNQPQWPQIEGVDGFAGKKMHSARWDWSYDLADKKIALLGNGKTLSQNSCKTRTLTRFEAVLPFKSFRRLLRWQKRSLSSNARLTGSSHAWMHLSQTS